MQMNDNAEVHAVCINVASIFLVNVANRIPFERVFGAVLNFYRKNGKEILVREWVSCIPRRFTRVIMRLYRRRAWQREGNTWGSQDHYRQRGDFFRGSLRLVEFFTSFLRRLRGIHSFVNSDILSSSWLDEFSSSVNIIWLALIIASRTRVARHISAESYRGNYTIRGCVSHIGFQRNEDVLYVPIPCTSVSVRYTKKKWRNRTHFQNICKTDIDILYPIFQ